MAKLFASIKKELLLLGRDFGGLVILFVMPMILLVAVTMVQNGSFDSILGAKMEVLLVDNDKGAISQRIKDGFKESGELTLVTSLDGGALTEETARAVVHRGDFQLAIVLPENLSRDLQAHVKHNVDEILSAFDFSADSLQTSGVPPEEKEIKLYFDPATQSSFKTAIRMTIDKLVSNIETKTIYATFQNELGDADNAAFSEQKFISFKEVVESAGGMVAMPNAVQHNVPAWILFGIFFIVVPLSINIVKEKNLGTSIRLNTSPISYLIILGGKIITYSIICMIQFFLMLMIANYLFPIIGLIPFESGGLLPILMLVAFIAGLAAIGLGILIGTIAHTQEQSAPFGAILVIILAALGGVWVPTFIMPHFMQLIARFSP